MEKLYWINKSDRQFAKYCRLITKMLTVLMMVMVASPLFSQAQYVSPDGNGDITFTPGLRLQPRYEYDASDKNNDIYVARVRIKGGGKAFGLATYYAEVKIDNVGRFNRTQQAQVENAWMNFAIKPEVAVRVGLYDMVFSRNALTSDSKLLILDRSLIKDALTVLGLADNTVGVLVHGRPGGGRFTYGFGVFDNLGFEVAGTQTTLTRKADGAMTTGRFVADVLDPAPVGGYGDYQGSYIGKGQRLSLGVNGAYLSKLVIGDNEFNLYAWGVDLFFNRGPATLAAEYATYKEDAKNGVSDSLNVDGGGWYVQGGYLLGGIFEPVAQYQELDPNQAGEASGDKLKWTTLGFNVYLRGHNLKIQADYILKNEDFKNADGTKINDDLLQVQLQLDF